MGKLDELRRQAGGNAAESMAARRTAAMHGASSPPATTPAVPERLRGVVRSKDAAEIPVDRIQPDPAQPREDFDEESLARLAGSLKSRGQLQPIRVRWEEGQGAYVIVCGERRWRAARMAGLMSLSCVIAEGPADAGELLALQLVENALREDLRPVEQARAYRALMDRNGWSTRELARELSIDQSGVVRALALLGLPEPVQEQVERGALPPATAYELAKAEDPEAQAELAARVVAEGLTRQATAEAVRQLAGRSKPKGSARRGRRPPTSRAFRAGHYKVVVECRRGVDDAGIRAALAEVLARLDGEAGAEGQAA